MVLCCACCLNILDVVYRYILHHVQKRTKYFPFLHRLISNHWEKMKMDEIVCLNDGKCNSYLFYNNPHTIKAEYKDQKFNQNGPRFRERKGRLELPTAVAQWVRALVLQAGGWVFKFQPGRP